MNGSPAGAARACLLAAINAADPREPTALALRGWGAGLAPRSVRLIAAGKGAARMVAGAAAALGDALRDGVAIVPAAPDDTAAPNERRDVRKTEIERVTVFAGGHPMPNGGGLRAAQAALQLLSDGGDGSRLLVLLSGGASAMMTLPAGGIAIEDIVSMSRLLMASGAGIRELNCVRKHLDRLKGGQMARFAGGAPIRALVLSDVIGDPLDVIASGPLVADPTTYADAIAVLRGRGVWDALPQAVRAHLLAGARGERPETPKDGDPCFANVAIEVIGNNALAVRGAADEARRRGFDVEVEPSPVSGEAREAGSAFGRRVREAASRSAGGRPRCIVGGGETTVTVTGAGIGGRNLEFAAAAALAIEGARGISIGSVGTDGRDGPTDAAGAVVDGDTVSRVRKAGMELAERLRDNDTLAALVASGAVMRTGATGTNVMDVYIATIAPA